MKIYQYYSAQKFIRDAFLAKKEKNAKYSVRAWAQNLGLKSHTTLHSVIRQKKMTPLSLYLPISDSLNLTPEESNYFLVLINIENAKDQYSRLMLLDKLETLRKYKNFKMTELSDFSLLSDPFWGLLTEMTTLRDFNNDPSWISGRTRIPKSSTEVRNVIATLIEKNILKNDQGQLSKTNQHISNVHDLANLGSQRYHKNCALLAAEQVELQPVETRDYNGYAMNIRTNEIEKMKSSIRKYIREFILEFEAKPGDGDATYQFNTQFFNLTKSS